jgi:hypothetical protein
MLKQHDLSKDEVRGLVYSYKDENVTDELYAFGRMLISEIGHRADLIDSKATITLGWATGIIAFLSVQSAKSIAPTALAVAVVASGLSAAMAIVYSFQSLRTREGWKWPSDLDWFEGTALCNADELKRFHIRSMHTVRQAQRDLTDRKVRYLAVAHRYLMVAGVLLACGLAINLLLPLIVPLCEFVAMRFTVPRGMLSSILIPIMFPTLIAIV